MTIWNLIIECYVLPFIFSALMHVNTLLLSSTCTSHVEWVISLQLKLSINTQLLSFMKSSHMSDNLNLNLLKGKQTRLLTTNRLRLNYIKRPWKLSWTCWQWSDLISSTISHLITFGCTLVVKPQILLTLTSSNVLKLFTSEVHTEHTTYSTSHVC